MKRLIILFGGFCWLFACRSDSNQTLVPDVSDIEVSFSSIRYEKALRNLDTTDLPASFSTLKTKYPAFTNLYFQNIVPIGRAGYQDDFYQELRELITDQRFLRLVDTVQMVFPDWEEKLLPELEKAFKNYKYYFPDFLAPDVYTLVSEYAYQQFLFLDEENEEAMGIGLDLFLGEGFPYAKIAPGMPSFSSYLTRTFNQAHIVRKAIATILDDRLTGFHRKTLLDHMIINGKKLYLLDHILPETPDSVIIEYSSAQLEWVKENELAIWAFFFNEDLFYETNLMKINKYINPSPNAPGMPPEAPGRTGNYMGWQIIKAYMNRYPETSLQELINLDDAQKIMDLSKYKPRK